MEGVAICFRAPVNQRMQAINQIEKGIRDAGMMSNGQSVEQLIRLIKKACIAKEYVFAREMLGHAIFKAAKGNVKRFLR